MSRTHTPNPASAQRGFNLVELLVALVIGVFLIAGTLVVYQESQGAMLISERMTRMLENGRFGLEMIEEDLRAVGLWGQTNNTNWVNGRAGPGDPVAINVNSDCENNWAVNFDTPIEGANNANLYPGSCLNGVFYRPQTDVLVVRHADEQDLTAADLVAGGLYIRSDQSHAQIFTGTVMPGGFPPTSQINRVATVAYFVSTRSDNDDPANPVPSLRRLVIQENGASPTVASEQVIAGVEDLQVQYGIDTTGDGSANSYVNADLVADPATVVAVRMWLRMRTDKSELAFVDDTTWEYADIRDRPSTNGTAADDPFRRALISKTVELRNRRIATRGGL